MQSFDPEGIGYAVVHPVYTGKLVVPHSIVDINRVLRILEVRVYAAVTS